MERNIAGGGSEIPVLVAAAIALADLASLISGILGQIFPLPAPAVQGSVKGNGSWQRGRDAEWITSSFSCTIFSDMVCRLLS